MQIFVVSGLEWEELVDAVSRFLAQPDKTTFVLGSSDHISIECYDTETHVLYKGAEALSVLIDTELERLGALDAVVQE